MKLRAADNKGRITGLEPGQVYQSWERENGEVVFHKVEIPDPPKGGDVRQLRAVYISEDRRVTTITIHSAMLNEDAVKIASEAAKLFKVPVVVDATGTGGAIADAVTDTGVEVIKLVKSRN